MPSSSASPSDLAPEPSAASPAPRTATPRRTGDGADVAPSAYSGFDREPWPRPLFAATVALMGGMALGDSMPWPVWLSPLGAGLTLALFATLQGRHHRRPRSLAPPPVAWLFLAVVFLGMWSAVGRAETRRRAEPLAQWAASHWIVAVEGVLAEPPHRLGGTTRLVLTSGARIQTETEEVESPLPVRVVVVDDTATDESAWRRRWRGVARGDAIRAVGSFRPPGHGYRNPGSSARSPTVRGEFVLGPLRVHSGDDVVVFPPPKRKLANRLLVGVARWGDAARDRLVAAAGERLAPVLLAIVLGDTTSIPSDSYASFQRAGLLHLFSVSGLHAGILAVGILGVLGVLRVPRRLQIVVVLAALLAYAALTGFRVPVVRTGIMAAALGAQPFLGRPSDALARLSLAALTILVLWPGSLFEIGFQLSFLAVFTLIVFGPWVAETVAFPRVEGAGWRTEATRIAQMAVRSVLLLTLLQIALAPLLATYFHQVSLIAPLSNLVVVPLVTGALLTGATIIGPGLLVPGLAALLEPVAAGLTGLAVWTTEVAAAIPFAAVSTASFPPLGAVLYFAVLFGGPYVLFGRGPGDRARRRARAWLHAAGMGVVLVAFPLLRPGEDSRLRIVFLDVGQGDCILLQLPDGAGTLLVDTGPPIRERGARHRVIPPVLRHYGIDAIDGVVATHADLDHIGGLPELFEELPVRRVLAPASLQGGALWREIETEIERRGIERLDTPLGGRLRTSVPDLTLDILHPREESLGAGEDRNTDSVVLHVAWRRFSMLLTGDADLATERLLRERWPEDALRALVLKAGHHGSRSSTGADFLAAVRPSFVVFACGRDNRYGHPHEEVLERCRARGAIIHRTDLHGALVLETDGKKLWVTAYGD